MISNEPLRLPYKTNIIVNQGKEFEPLRRPNSKSKLRNNYFDNYLSLFTFGIVDLPFAFETIKSLSYLDEWRYTKESTMSKFENLTTSKSDGNVLNEVKYKFLFLYYIFFNRKIIVFSYKRCDTTRGTKE